MGIKFQRVHLADGHDALYSNGVESVWVELCLQRLEVVCTEMPLQDLSALGVSKTSCQVASIAQWYQVIASVPLVVIEDHWRLPAWIVQENS